ncbi:HsmA family protein [Spirochaetota bacterium]
MLIAAIITITLALIFYTLGVWGEKLSRGLNKWNLSMFWIGLIMDTTGTTLMLEQSDTVADTFHLFTGVVAIVLMAIHAVWATIVLIRKNDKMIRDFHKFSFIVWLIWLVPYFSGMVMRT